MDLKTVNIKDIIPYANNPRKNDKAAIAVAKSIEECGYCAPIVVDEDMVVLAGHTRLKALYKLNQEQVQIIQVSGLTEDQKKKYRLLDNKTNEFAMWDYELLKQEIDGIHFDLSFEMADLLMKADNLSDDRGYVEGAEDTESEEDDVFAPDEELPNTCTCPRCGCTFPEGV